MDKSWLIFGDFNQVLNPQDKLSSTPTQGGSSLRELMDGRGIAEIESKGYWFTWTNDRKGDAIVMKDIDRFMCVAQSLIIIPEA